MTIKEAAIQILQAKQRPMTAQEVLAEIELQNLFAFKTKGKRGVVLAALKRHSINSHSCAPAKNPVFREVGKDQFELVSK